ncbi:rubredoxin-like domain-containing protein [Holophaga foetida]|uniref:rubredoxin-like domain-containing protein n=1 Tax=Holophaga foetida TaxID=35839 RepID=UPI0002472F19|nr:hypothetical protein [Holophaga foetida]
MAKYLRCRACDYIAEEGQLGDVCPACGLPRTVFEAYPKDIAARRRFLVEQHLHPIAVHLPQVLLFCCVLLPILAHLLPQPYHAEFMLVAKWAVLVLPFGAIAAFVSGLVDGKLRFKKLQTPLLKRKIVAGVAFLALSVLVFVLYLLFGFHGANTWAIVLLSAVATGFAVFLGKTGATLFSCMLPG